MKILVTTTLNKNLTEAKMKPLIALDEVERIFYVSDRPGPELAKVRYYCVPKSVLRIFNNNSTVRMFFKLYMVFYVAVFKKPDLLMGYSFMPHGINAALIGRILKIPSCIHVIGSVPSAAGGGFTCGNNNILRMLRKSGFLEKVMLDIAKGARIITVTGSNTRDYLVSKGIDKKNIEILPSAVDTRRFFPVAGMKKEYDLITMGELIPSKRIDLFLEIVWRLKRQGLDVKSVILGEGPLRQYLAGLAEKMEIKDCVYFAGFNTSVEDYLTKSRIFLMPTESEGLSLAMLEAMACGVVPVVSRVGDLADAVEDGLNGTLVAKDDIDAFCSSVYKLLKDKESYEAFSRNAIETIESRYAIRNASEKWRAILKGLVEPGRKASSWLFNRLKAMSFQEMAYRLIRVLRTKMLGLEFSCMTKNGRIAQRNFRKPKFFIDEKDIDFIRGHAKEKNMVSPPLKDIDWHVDIGFKEDINRRAGFSALELIKAWDLNRFQWLMPCAQKYAIDKDEDAALKIRGVIKDWIEKNPVLNGMNWMDPLEISMRLLSWSYIYFLIRGSKAVDRDFEDIFLKSIYCQIRFVEENLSRYSSANNHLIGEAVGLFTAGVLFPQLKGSEKRLQLGKEILEEEIKKQVYSDGVGKEQSTHYHEFITELYLIAVILGRRNGIHFSVDLNSRLEKMCEFIMYMMDGGLGPLNIGDSDDRDALKLNMPEPFSNPVFILNSASVLFNIPDFKIDKNGFDEKSLWLLGYEGYRRYSLLETAYKDKALTSKDFPEGGYYIMRHEGLFLHFDCGKLGYLSIAAHAHADSLSFTLSINGRQMFIDPGTYLYHSDTRWRNYFRGTSGHNTIRIDRQDQSEIHGPFLWGHKARAYLKDWSINGRFDRASGYHTGYSKLKDPVVHSREMILDKSKEEIVITDSISSKGGHLIEQFFHLHPDCSLKRIRDNLFEIINKDVVLVMEIDSGFDSRIYSGNEFPIAGWYSGRFGEKQKCITICNMAYSNASKEFVTKIFLSNFNVLDGKEK